MTASVESWHGFARLDRRFAAADRDRCRLSGRSAGAVAATGLEFTARGDSRPLWIERPPGSLGRAVAGLVPSPRCRGRLRNVQPVQRRLELAAGQACRIATWY